MMGKRSAGLISCDEGAPISLTSRKFHAIRERVKVAFLTT